MLSLTEAPSAVGCETGDAVELDLVTGLEVAADECARRTSRGLALCAG
jgi:hypothetical protein